MQIIYRTIDGKEFLDKDEATSHETSLGKGLKMWNRDGNEVADTASAFAVLLVDENATETFLHIAKEQKDHDMSGINRGEYGFFVWDEWELTYRYVDADFRKAVVVAQNYIDENNLKVY